MRTGSAPWVWQRFGVTVVDTGSARCLSVPGAMLVMMRRVIGLTVLGQSVTVFDLNAEYLPFNIDKPDAPGFRIGRYYVAFNRGRA